MSGCAASITVSNQADVNKLNSSYCSNIVIQGATGTLNFTTLKTAGTITVHDSPALEVLRFPQLLGLSTLTVTNATALTTMTLPMFSPGSIGYTGDESYFQAGSLFNLNISTAPNLSTLELKNLTSYGDLALFDTAPLPLSDLGTNNISAAILVQTNSCVEFSRLRDVGELQIFATPGCDYLFFSLRSAGNITLSNANSFFALTFASDGSFGIPPIRINNSLILESSAPPDPTFSEGQIKLDRITTVGEDLKISSMSNLYMDFESLTDVGGDLSLIDNTNCTWNFGQVTSAGSLTLLDNENTIIPLFSHLQTVENIHLRGNIDTSSGPNIFPTLVLASGNVTVEAWNSDFNCSKLVSQWNDGLIHNLSCNGTGGTGTSTSNPASTSAAKLSSSPHLTTGALAGIGVGSGVFVLLVIVTIVWLVLHYKRRIKSLERAHPQTLPIGHQATQNPSRPHISSIHEVDGTGIIREKPHDPVLPELSVLGPELPTSP
ncbi:hypothetical protein HD806DRAFT_389108 [Xylariaceae sp. AK1471]|nr:hypothetical protein HD806DRAFT_389108 [Xylariaceae sp. AK1471]